MWSGWTRVKIIPWMFSILYLELEIHVLSLGISEVRHVSIRAKSSGYSSIKIRHKESDDLTRQSNAPDD